MSKSKHLTRRTFVKQSAAGIAVIGGAAAGSTLLKSAPLFGANNKSGSAAIEYRTLGNTGLKMTTLGFGAMRTSNPAVIRRAIDKGVNNIDTARGYMGGRNEEIVGRAIGDIRDDVIITTKIKVNGKSRMFSDMDASLRALGSDYFDIVLIHAQSSLSDINNEDAREFLTKVKKDGKARFIGFSTHRNMANLLNAAAEDGFYDVVLTAYNFKHGEDMTSAVKNASKAGVGVIAMKTQAGGYESSEMGNLSPHQASLKWVLQNKSVANTIPSMVTYEQVDENFQVMNENLGFLDKKTLYRYGDLIDKDLCRFCDECSGQCSMNVSVPDINRCVMYADGYGDLALGKTNYSEIPAAQTAAQCIDCDDCLVQCVNGIDVASKMKRAKELFA